MKKVLENKKILIFGGILVALIIVILCLVLVNREKVNIVVAETKGIKLKKYENDNFTMDIPEG